VKTSGIITITTDFGLADPYVAMMKGVILSIHSAARLVDLTHQIRPGFVLQAAGLIRETFIYFPDGTVHLAVVDPGVGGARRSIALEAGGHFFVGPDNGLFWPILHDHPENKPVHLTESKYFLSRISHTFHGRDLFSPVAAHLSLGVPLERFGPVINDPVELALPKPRGKGDTLHGQILRLDNFGNLITNIHRTELERFLESARPVIRVGDLDVEKFGHIYSDVEEGEALALIGSSGWLEIAVNLGRAAEYTGLDTGEIIGAAVKITKT